MALSKKERDEFKQDSSSRAHPQYKAKHASADKKNNKKILLYSVSSVFIIVVLVVGGFTLVQAGKPGPLDDFAKCLSENDAVMYGASFCEYSHAQKGMFGKSKKYLNLKDYTENSDVRITPTWYVEGEKYENVQTLRRLSQLTGCPLPGYETVEEESDVSEE